MIDENKNFKSKTIELFGLEFKVFHKNNNIINNKFLIMFGLIKFYFKKYLSKFYLNNLYEPLILFTCIYLIFLITIVIIITFSEIDNRVNNCLRGCEIAEKYCSEFIRDNWTVLKTCIQNNISFLEIAYEIFGWIILQFEYVLLLLIVFYYTLIHFIKYAYILIKYIYDMVYNILFMKIYKFNKNIPSIEEV